MFKANNKNTRTRRLIARRLRTLHPTTSFKRIFFEMLFGLTKVSRTFFLKLAINCSFCFYAITGFKIRFCR